MGHCRLAAYCPWLPVTLGAAVGNFNKPLPSSRLRCINNCSFEPYSELYAFQCLWYPSAIVEWFDFPINDEFGSCTNTIHILRNNTNDKPHLLCFPWIKTMADLLWLQKEKMPVIIILEHLQESYFRGWSAVAAAVWPAFFITCAFRNQPSTNRNHRSFLIHLCSWCEYNLQ